VGTPVTYAYDTASRLQILTSSGFSTTYGYLANSPLVETTTSKQTTTTRLTTTRQYDLLNRLQSITPTPTVTAQPPMSRAYAYNSANQRLLRTDGDSSSWRYEYDNKGQVTVAKHSSPYAELIPGQQFEFDYDDVGSRLNAREGGDQNGNGLRQMTYVPNNLNQYSSRSINAVDRKVDVMGLALVANGMPTTVSINEAAPDYRRGEYFWKQLAGGGAGPNWLEVRVVAGAFSSIGNVYISPQSESFGYDLDGNLTSDARWVYKWDAENRLARIETQVTAAAVGVPPKRIQFFYDFQGRLIRRQLFSGTYNPGMINWFGSPDTAPGADLLFLYDGPQCIAALNPAQTLYQAYVWGLDFSGTVSGAGGVGGLVMFRRTVGPSTETYFPTLDGNANVTGLVKGEDAGAANSAGTVAARYEYGTFGHLLRVSGEPVALDNPFRFSTKYQDDYSDFLYYGYRFYNVGVGNWLNRDPLQELGGPHLYGFLRNHPVNSYDVLGLYEEVGHFYTIYAVARAAGLPLNQAFKLAYYGQIPDEVPGLDAFALWKAMNFGAGAKPIQSYIPKDSKVEQWAEPVMTLLHSLHGGGKDSVLKRRQCLLNLLKDPNIKPWERGLILHAFGDAFAHVHGTGDKLQAYPYPNGHGFASALGNDPDLISNFPNRYKDYVKSLYQGLAGPGANPELLNRIQNNATSLRGSHEKQNSAMAAFVQGPGFDYSSLPEPYKNFHPEGGKKLLPNDPNFPTPTSAQIQALMDKIRKACCGEKK